MGLCTPWHTCVSEREIERDITIERAMRTGGRERDGRTGGRDRWDEEREGERAGGKEEQTGGKKVSTGSW